MFILESQVRILIKFSRFIIVNYFIFFQLDSVLKIFSISKILKALYMRKNNVKQYSLSNDKSLKEFNF
nr:MAG TPA: hypothetical protein [Caudoviricetes sp.]